MTANVLQEDVQQYFDAGMNAFVSKPFNADELLLKIDSVMEYIIPAGNNRKEEKTAEGRTVFPAASGTCLPI